MGRIFGRGPLVREAVWIYANRFAAMEGFYLYDPNGCDLAARWKERPSMLSLPFYFTERNKRAWMTDGGLDWLWPAAEQAGVPMGSPPRWSYRLSARSFRSFHAHLHRLL